MGMGKWRHLFGVKNMDRASLQRKVTRNTISVWCRTKDNVSLHISVCTLHMRGLRSLYVRRARSLFEFLLRLTQEKNCWMLFPVNRLSTTHTMHLKCLPFNFSFYFSSPPPTRSRLPHRRTRCTFHCGKSYTINFHVVNVFGALNQRRWFIFTIFFSSLIRSLYLCSWAHEKSGYVS